MIFFSCSLKKLLFFMALAVTGQISNSATIYKKVMQQNMASVNYEDEDWSTEKYDEFLRLTLKTQQELQEFKRRRAVYLMFDRLASAQDHFQESVLQDIQTWQDLTLFCGQKDPALYLASKIDRTHTAFGKIMFYAMLAQPTSNCQELERRQSIIKLFLDNELVYQQIEKTLLECKQAENFLLSFWANDPFKQATQSRYFKFDSKKVNGFLNSKPLALNIRNMLDCQQRLITAGSLGLACGVLPIYAGTLFYAGGNAGQQFAPWQERLVQNLQGQSNPAAGFVASMSESAYFKGTVALMATFLCSLKVNEAYCWARDNFTLDEYVHIKVQHLARAWDVLKKLNGVLNQHLIVKERLQHAKNLTQLFDENNQSPEFKRLISLLESKAITNDHSFWTNKGKVFIAFRLMHEIKQEFEPALLALAELDAYFAAARLYNEFNTSRTPYCFVSFVDESKPRIELRDFFSPFVDSNKVITNSFELGGAGAANMLITGPNAGGKSTVLKAVATAVVMAQSFGIAPAKQMLLTPFSKIITYLNITDDIAVGNSLFKAQVLRAQELVEMQKELQPDQFSFMAIDEMFNGTSPKEAEAAAYSVAHSLGAQHNSSALIATHFPLLTELEKQTSNFVNYNVSVERHRDGSISYPFILSKGISNQHVALDILRSEGFNSQILENAARIVNQSH